MSFSNNSTSIDRKKFAAEQELQESLSSSECETRPLKHSSAEEQRSDRSEEFNNPQIVNSSLNLEIQKEIVNYIWNTMIIDLNPEYVLLDLGAIWKVYDQYEKLTPSRRILLFAIGINIKSNPNWNIVKRHLKKFAEQLKTEESLGTKKTWKDIEPELKILLRQYAKAKLFTPPTKKVIANENVWRIWIRYVFTAIYFEEYSIERLRNEIMEVPSKYPLR
ncbi:hypothetical protein NEIRO03_1610 [Nematocida sp. AWRm78]|nr:hypothetical protein NEIRO02_0633 [Nematocida sp. AWRm79]KAI5184154.1 hypothetical protein NEIRO03_1610 [Nematocida sp. AWRm78]